MPHSSLSLTSGFSIFRSGSSAGSARDKITNLDYRRSSPLPSASLPSTPGRRAFAAVTPPATPTTTTTKTGSAPQPQMTTIELSTANFGCSWAERLVGGKGGFGRNSTATSAGDKRKDGKGSGCGGLRVTVDTRNGTNGNNVQQLSTSWEFIRPTLELKSEDERDEPQDFTPPRFIKISDGKISLGPPIQNECSSRDREVLEARIFELEEALIRLQDKVNNSQCGSPTLERDLKDQLESMSRAMKSKDRKAMQACRDHKVLQARFSRQESLLHIMRQENRTLQQRIRQYEHCLDDVMRKVVDAIVAEDNLREEVSMLKTRVRDLEAQNAALSASPAKGRDEGYCTMSSGQPQPSNSHLEDLPEEPEQWLVSAEPCTAEMEDWSMSQEELGVIALDDESNDIENDWIWNSSGYLNSTMIDSQSEGISQLLKETLVYSDDEEIACIDFTKDFYKLVNIPSASSRSLHSHMDAETDDEDESSSESVRILQRNNMPSPTPSEAGRAQVTSCSSSDSGDQSRITNLSSPEKTTSASICDDDDEPTNIVKCTPISNDVVETKQSTEDNPLWRKSNGWKRVGTQPTSKDLTNEAQKSHRHRESKIPPPVPVRRSYAS